MESGHYIGDLIGVCAGQLAAVEHALEHPGLVELSHSDRVLDGLSITADARVCGLPGDGNNIQVQLGREAPVQPQLLLAAEAALLERREIQKAEIQRLLELIRVLAGQEHVRDVGLDMFDLARRMGIANRVQQRADQIPMRILPHLLKQTELSIDGRRHVVQTIDLCDDRAAPAEEGCR